MVCAVLSGAEDKPACRHVTTATHAWTPDTARNVGSKYGSIGMQLWFVIGFCFSHIAGGWYSLSPQVPDAYFAVVTRRDYAVLLLMCKVYVSDRH